VSLLRVASSCVGVVVWQVPPRRTLHRLETNEETETRVVAHGVVGGGQCVWARQGDWA
jgi:hypothetical protein